MLFHVSEEPGIERFEPRPGRQPRNQQGEGAVTGPDDLRGWWAELKGRWDAYLAELTPEALDEPVYKVSTTSGRGRRFGTRRADVPLHLCTHAQYTAAQAVNMLRQAWAAELPDVMLISLARQEREDALKIVQPPSPWRKDATMARTRSKTAFILLFRGVGGATQLPTAPLREALTEAGFENVTTYINSGNAVLRTHLSRAKVIAAVAEICRDHFGFTKAILAPTLEEWSALIDNNPFPQVVATPTFLHAAVLAVEPAARAIRRLRLAER